MAQLYGMVTVLSALTLRKNPPNAANKFDVMDCVLDVEQKRTLFNRWKTLRSARKILHIGGML